MKKEVAVMYKDRREWIHRLLLQKPFVSYEELCREFPQVSQMTLRRDIDYFEKRGEALKVRGGARSARFITEDTDDPFSNRKKANIQSKMLIARKAAEYLEVGRSIYIDSGSTLQQLIPFVPNERFTFTTTNPSTAIDLSRIGQPIVNLVGGRLDHDYQSVSGTQALRFLADVNIDLAFMSPSGLSDRSGFTGGNYSECEFKRAVIEKARKIVMLMDLSKADRSLPYTFCELDKVDVLICDGPLPPALAEQAACGGVSVINVCE